VAKKSHIHEEIIALFQETKFLLSALAIVVYGKITTLFSSFKETDNLINHKGMAN